MLSPAIKLSRRAEDSDACTLSTPENHLITCVFGVYNVIDLMLLSRRRDERRGEERREDMRREEKMRGEVRREEERRGEEREIMKDSE